MKSRRFQEPRLYNKNVRGKKTRSPGFEPGQHWVICDVCGFAVRAEDARTRWDDAVVCVDDWEPRQPQDFVRAVTDQIASEYPIRPDQDNIEAPPEIDLSLPVQPLPPGGIVCKSDTNLAGFAQAGCARARSTEDYKLSNVIGKNVTTLALLPTPTFSNVIGSVVDV